MRQFRREIQDLSDSYHDNTKWIDDLLAALVIVLVLFAFGIAMILGIGVLPQ